MCWLDKTLYLGTIRNILLKASYKFTHEVNSDEWKEQDGSYVVFDSRCSIYIRTATAEVSLKRQWKDHISSSKKPIPINKCSILDNTYDHPNIMKENKPPMKSRKGNFMQLKQMAAISYKRETGKSMVSLFNWSEP